MVETTRRGVERSVAGWREWIHLPELGLDPLVLEVNSSPGSAASKRLRVSMWLAESSSLSSAKGRRTAPEPAAEVKRLSGMDLRVA